MPAGCGAAATKGRAGQGTRGRGGRFRTGPVRATGQKKKKKKKREGEGRKGRRENSDSGAKRGGWVESRRKQSGKERGNGLLHSW